jgi:AraC family transcriptional regulator
MAKMQRMQPSIEQPDPVALPAIDPLPSASARPGMQVPLLQVQRPLTPWRQLPERGTDVRQRTVAGGLPRWQLRRAQQWLVADLQAGASVSKVAARCGLSRGYFCQAFKRSTGCTPHRWLREFRIAQAKALLLGAMPIIEVASRCGFADQSHLTRVFGRVVGMPPARWRALNK